MLSFAQRYNKSTSRWYLKHFETKLTVENSYHSKAIKVKCCPCPCHEDVQGIRSAAAFIASAVEGGE
jgi:hypothetical protein